LKYTLPTPVGGEDSHRPRQQREVFGALFVGGSDRLQWSSTPAGRDHWEVNFLKFSHPQPQLLVAVNGVRPFTVAHHQQVWVGL